MCVQANSEYIVRYREKWNDLEWAKLALSYEIVPIVTNHLLPKGIM